MTSIQSSLASPARVGGLRRLLGTIDADTFLRTHIGEQMLHVSGARDLWSDVFSWQELNTVLSGGFVGVPRVRLVSKGVTVDTALYADDVGQRQVPDSRRVQDLMARGATLILQSVEGINPRLNAFVRELERDLGADVRVDVVATTATVPGLNMHWDNAECFNVQLDGEKQWQVIPPERPHPLTATTRFPKRSDLLKPTAPDVPPTWEGVMTPGDLIYLPRGWWHAVTPLISPSLHLSIAVDVPTLHDFLHWYALDAVRHESVRRSLPVWQTTTERRDRIANVLTSLKDSLTTDDVERYLTDFGHFAALRPDYALPYAAAPGAPHLTPQTTVRLRSSRPLGWTLDGDTVHFAWRGQPYRFHVQLLMVLQKLETMRTFTLDELSDGCNRLLVRACVLALLTSGLVNVTERVDPSATREEP
jgi:ribosomal protein L16 Arg81 hydroxylase